MSEFFYHTGCFYHTTYQKRDQKRELRAILRALQFQNSHWDIDWVITAWSSECDAVAIKGIGLLDRKNKS